MHQPNAPVRNQTPICRVETDRLILWTTRANGSRDLYDEHTIPYSDPRDPLGSLAVLGADCKPRFRRPRLRKLAPESLLSGRPFPNLLKNSNL